MFGLKDVQKEGGIAYRYYTEQNIYEKRTSIKTYKSFMDSEKTKRDFDEFFDDPDNKLNFNYDGTHFNASAYYQHYLWMDCFTLREGLRVFRDNMLKIPPHTVDIHDYLTISSVAMAFVEKSGALDNTTMLSLSLRAFVGRSVSGGRTAVTPGFERIMVTGCGEDLIKKLKTKGEKKFTKKEIEALKENSISDFDGVSLYPSAMERISVRSPRHRQ